MLVLNPLNELLFKYGYEGKENIYEFWIENKEEAIQFFYKKAKKLMKNKLVYMDFEIKMRWCSPMGMQLKYEVKEAIKNGHDINKEYMDEFSFYYDGRNQRLVDFINTHPLDWCEDNIKQVDLRGISLVRLKAKGNYLKDIDLSFASFDGSDFHSLSFENCNLQQTRFCRIHFEQVDFRKNCKMHNTDFSDSIIDARFDCSIEGIKVTHAKEKKIKQWHKSGNKRFPPCTIFIK